LKKRYFCYLEYKDELIGQLTQGKKDAGHLDRMTSTGRNSPKNNPYMDDISVKRSANDQNSLREQNRSPLSREGGQLDDIISKISGYGSQKTQKMAKRDRVYSIKEAENLFWVFFQQKVKQSFQHMFLNILGNILCCYKPKDELVALEK